MILIKNSNLITTVYFVRHAEIENPEDIHYGRLSGFPLSKKGKKHAQKLSDYFKNKRIKAIYSSPLLRTKETALILNSDLSLKISYSDLISEWRSKWEGLKEKDIPENDMLIYKTRPTVLRAGETMEGLAERMSRFLKGILKKHQGQSIVCVSHADPISILRLSVQGKSLDLLWEYPCKLGSITKMTFNSSKLIGMDYKEV